MNISAQAKYAFADVFYFEAGHSNLSRAESEFRKFITFFPDHELADDAQLKVAMTHIKQVQKPDRDDTEARLAEFELNVMINEYPDSHCSRKPRRSCAVFRKFWPKAFWVRQSNTTCGGLIPQSSIGARRF